MQEAHLTSLRMDRTPAGGSGRAWGGRVVRWAAAVWLLVASAAGAQEKFQLKEKGFEKAIAFHPDSPEGKLQRVRKELAAGEGKAAYKLADRWIKDHPNHNLRPEAYLLRADSWVVMKDYYSALFDYEYVVRGFPGTDAFNIAMDREFKIAQAFAQGLKRKFLGMQILSATDTAEEIFIRIQERAPGSALAERAGKELADYYYNQSEMDLAVEAYELFLKNYPQSQWKQHGMLRLIQANIATFKWPEFDVTGLLEAQRRLLDYKAAFPAGAEKVGADALLLKLEESIASRGLLVAQWYDRKGKLVSAKYLYQRLITDHPRTGAAIESLKRLKQIDPTLYEDANQRLKAAGAAAPDNRPAVPPTNPPPVPGTLQPAPAPPPAGRAAHVRSSRGTAASARAIPAAAAPPPGR